MSRLFVTLACALGVALSGSGVVLASADESPIDRRIKEAAATTPKIERADDWTREVRSLPFDPVVEAHKPGPDRAFQVETRTDKIRRAPCSTCHVGPMDKIKRGIAADPSALGHGAVEVVHAPIERMACQTCHDYEHGMLPKTQTGVSLNFDRAYELCAGCHASQYTDWRGGAHGKRLGNWTGTRTVRSCTGCHDPHKPAFSQKAPATFAAPPATWEAFRP
jgi:predicted CXXCH cytochrome family protein